MKKSLLIAAFAMLGVASSFAFEVGDYATNSTQRFKITGENLVVNGNFASGLDGWYSIDKETAPSADVWSIEEGAGPNGEKVVSSIAATADMPLCNSWELEGGTYVVSYQVKTTAGTNLMPHSVATSNNVTTVSVPANCADFFINTTGDFARLAPTEEAPVTGVASMVYVSDEWKTIVYSFTIEEGKKFVMHFEKLVEGTQIANVEIHKAEPTYDVRIAQNQIAFAKELMENPAFNTEEAQDAKSNLQSTIELLEGMIADGSMDDASNAESLMQSFNDEALEPFLAVTSVDVKTQIPGLDIASLANWGRGGKYSADYKLDLWGGNWGHLNTEQDVLRSAIQTGYANSATYAAFHEDFPAGKYFFSCEIRNANTGRTSWPTEPVFNLETTCKLFVGNDTLEVGPISGEEFQRFGMVGEVTEDGKFRAGVEWPGATSGGAFFIRNTVVRAFEKDVTTKAEHIQAFKKYIEQWNAATNARYTVHNLIDNANYPWGQNELKAEADRLDPYFAEQAGKKWSTLEGADAGIASTEELSDWALYQGFELYSEPTETDPEGKRLEYQLVRGYQGAASKIKTLNAPFTDLATAIDEAKKTRNKGTNATGDRDAFKTAILSALNTLTTVRSTTTDATRDADSTTLVQAQEALANALATFLASAEVKPIVDIDFSTPAELVQAGDEGEEYYVIKGAAGEMNFGMNFQPDNTVADYLFAQGTGEELTDRLHVGGDSYGSVALPELGDNDVLEITFDLWYGQLGKAFQEVELLNAAGTRVAGFSYDSYNNNVRFNEFDNAENTGMNIKGNVNSANDKSGGAAAVGADSKVNKFKLTLDYKNKTLQGTIVSKGLEGVAIPMNTAEDADNKVVTFRVGGYNHQKANSGAYGRRAWFDNLVIYRYADVAGDIEEDITQSPWADTTEWVDGIKTISIATNDNAVYTLSGLRLKGAVKPGLYIVNGRKVVIK